jgi:hypothetical protein
MTDDTKQAVKELREALARINAFPSATISGPAAEQLERAQANIYSVVLANLPAVLDRLEELEGIDRPHQTRDCFFKISRDRYKELWETSCEHIGEACEILGIDPTKRPADTWTLREAAVRVVAERDAERARFLELRAAMELMRPHHWNEVSGMNGENKRTLGFVDEESIRAILTRFPVEPEASQRPRHSSKEAF